MSNDGRQVVHKHRFSVQVITFSQNVRFSLGKLMKTSRWPLIFHSIWHPSGGVTRVPGGSKNGPFRGLGFHFGIAIAMSWATWGPFLFDRLKTLQSRLVNSTAVFSFKLDNGVVMTYENFQMFRFTCFQWLLPTLHFPAGKRHSGPNVLIKCDFMFPSWHFDGQAWFSRALLGPNRRRAGQFYRTCEHTMVWQVRFLGQLCTEVAIVMRTYLTSEGNISCHK